MFQIPGIPVPLHRNAHLTSNQSFGSWGDVFGDRVIASAILDRILHHATTISIRGDSYRLKDKLKSGVVKPTMAGT